MSAKRTSKRRSSKRTSRPRALEPNSPQKRIEFVFKQYWKKYPNACLDTVTVAAFLFGIDRDAPSALLRSQHAWREFERNETEQTLMLKRLDDHDGVGRAILARERDQTNWPETRQDWSLVMLVIFIADRFPKHHEYESIVPWVARELVALMKAKPIRWQEDTATQWRGFPIGRELPPDPGPGFHLGDREVPIVLRYAAGGGAGTWSAYVNETRFTPIVDSLDDAKHFAEQYELTELLEELTELLKQKITAIAQWAKETRIDIGKVTVAQALDAIATYTFKTSLVPQGDVVYTFADGWTVQELRAAPALKAEGSTMQHCVGSYCDQVEEGNSRIYSLRDPSGNPHVTMEWQPSTDQILADGRGKRHAWDEYVALSPAELLRSRFARKGHFEQIYGKQNEKPNEKYVPRVREFIEKMFNGNVRALLLLDIPLDQLDLRGQNLRGMEFRDTTTGGLDGYDFTGSDMTDCVFAKNYIQRCVFQRCVLVDADFSECRIIDSNFRECNASGALFDNAQFTGALNSFKDADVDQASFVGVRDAQRLLAGANGRAYADHFARRMGTGPVYVDEGRDDPNDEDDAYPE